MTIPTQAGPDTICECSHWYEEHFEDICEGCHVGGAYECKGFVFSALDTTPDAIIARGGDPDFWPDWVKGATQ